MAAEVDMGKFSFPRGQIENWGDSGVVVTGPRSTDASTDVDTDDRNQAPSTISLPKVNAFAAVYIFHNDLSFVADKLDIWKGAMAFDIEYAQWLDEHQRLINDLRSALNARVVDDELQLHVDALMTHYDEVFRLKSIAQVDIILKKLQILASHLEPLTDQQLMGICNLQQSSQQAEDALSQGMEALQQSLSDTLASASVGASAGTDNVASYMGQMAIAMGKLGTLESFLRQADLLRQQTLRQMHRILTTRQAAHALLAISDYFSRLRALSSLWLARPRVS
ncbi:putative TGACG-sequence-specific DNA-binding protein TGA-2.1 [Cocos nucifera]|uniref:Putative TGACG-sequence-specific DNA-binding protein TGA-2.1 n=1 Tax=Cocos nucifera TaxID=13894 RepID=A0A8K0IGV6_COCNU|nr:putative TGACG-sequence-specific DNA-binding protein TGA-2.1 [Cocos nucifera]